MDITVKMARFQAKQSVLIGNTTLGYRRENSSKLCVHNSGGRKENFHRSA